jgi:ATP-binding cassette subfamily A (ABC1) protein 3
MVSGSSLPAYWLSNYLADVIFHSFGAVVALLGIYLFDVVVPEVYHLFGLIIFANPVFIYFVSFFFDKDESGSLAINIIFFIFGIIAPISLTVLQIISVDMYNASQSLRWLFFPIPIFSLTYGYISIINIEIITYMIKTESGEEIRLQPYDD